jgi:aspartate racemase
VATLGIVGGLGPESTIDYYRRILEEWKRDDPSSSPSIIIDSLDVDRGLRLVEHDRPALVEYLLASLRRLAAAGADVAAMAANTPHVVFDDLVARSPVPIVSIVKACAEDAQRRDLRRLGLLGTRFTMEGSFYPNVFARRGIAVVSPNGEERAWIHDRYVGQLLKGDFRDETRDGVTKVIKRLREEENIDGVILGGTELTLLLSGPVVGGVPALDTTALHVDAIVNRLRLLTTPRPTSSIATFRRRLLRVHGAILILVALGSAVATTIGWMTGSGLFGFMQRNPLVWVGLIQAYLLMTIIAVLLVIGSREANPRKWNVVGALAHCPPLIAALSSLQVFASMGALGIVRVAITFHAVWFSLEAFAALFPNPKDPTTRDGVKSRAAESGR